MGDELNSIDNYKNSIVIPLLSMVSLKIVVWDCTIVGFNVGDDRDDSVAKAEA